MVFVYLLCAWLLLGHLGPDRPLLWPCLYLIFGLTQFQMIIWSLPGSRYMKLLCLSIAASIITFGWMFFVPSIVAGALSEMGYTGNVEDFMRRLLVGLALTGPAAYLISLFRVHQQRRGLTGRSSLFTGWWDKTIGRSMRRRAPFRSADHAILWQEWRRSGFILPIVVVFVIALTCVPAWLSGELSGRATMGILTWLFIAPFLFALIIGRGFGKPDFWSTNLKIPQYSAIRPVTPGQWVAAKLKTALGSAVLTWSLSIYLGFIWTAFAGDFQGLQAWLMRIRFYYSGAERWLMLVLAFPAVVIVTWRLLIAGLATGLWGRKMWYLLLNGMTGIGMVGLFILTIWRSDNENTPLRFYYLWPAIAWLPIFLPLAVAAKMTAATFAWEHALRHGMASRRSVEHYFTGWLFAVGILETLCYILCGNTLWLRYLLMMAAILVVPLAGPALAMRGLAGNRSSP